LIGELNKKDSYSEDSFSKDGAKESNTQAPTNTQESPDNNLDVDP
jgi:hypothetical protein